jgi:hypothetical protein
MSLPGHDLHCTQTVERNGILLTKQKTSNTSATSNTNSTSSSTSSTNNASTTSNTNGTSSTRSNSISRSAYIDSDRGTTELASNRGKTEKDNWMARTESPASWDQMILIGHNNHGTQTERNDIFITKRSTSSTSTTKNTKSTSNSTNSTSLVYRRGLVTDC